MPKSVSFAMKTHLAQGVTTLAGCWKIVRTDGQTFGFTTFDSDLIVEGFNYRSIDGFSSTAIQSGATGQIDNLQVLGFFNEDGISQADVKNRLFDYARIYLFFINWADLNMAPIKMRTGWLGETVVTQNGAFAAELRGLTQALVQELGNFYSPLCRNDLGDNHCKVPIRPPFWEPDRRYNIGDYVRDQGQQVITNDTFAQAIFMATTDGMSAHTPPGWNPSVGGTTSDYQITWLCQPSYSQIGTVATPIDQHSFVSSPLSFPASPGAGEIASILVMNSVSEGTAVEVTDGIGNTATTTWPWDQKQNDAINLMEGLLTSSGLHMFYTPRDNGFDLHNYSGAQGNISKTGDILGAIHIDNFTSPGYLDAGGITWITGGNAGVTMELKHYDAGTNIITMYLGMLLPIHAGDRFWSYPGCDKRRDTCVRNFNNIINNRSEPDIPGVDKMLSYPDA